MFTDSVTTSIASLHKAMSDYQCITATATFNGNIVKIVDDIGAGTTFNGEQDGTVLTNVTTRGLLYYRRLPEGRSTMKISVAIGGLLEIKFQEDGASSDDIDPKVRFR